MRSRAHHIKGHPIHPMLVPFPIAFLVGAFIFDLVGVASGTPGWYVAGKYMAGAGVVMGLVAAVPGAIDFLWSVPPKSSAKRHARKHLLLNAIVILLSALAYWVRGAPGVAPDAPILGLELVAVALLTWAVFIGGTLVFRNEVGVDHRYAGAGRWRETTVRLRAGESVTVARVDELQPNQMKLLRVGKRRVVLARTDDGWAAFDDHCSHRGGSLADGTLACGVVQCPWHGSQYDVRTGSVRAGPARQALATYPLEVVGDEVRLTL